MIRPVLAPASPAMKTTVNQLARTLSALGIAAITLLGIHRH
jgi:hypothetical protein